MLGHALVAMTSDTYADLFDDDLGAVAMALNTAASKRSMPMAVMQDWACWRCLPQFV